MKKQKKQSTNRTKASDTHLSGSGPFAWDAVQDAFRAGLETGLDAAAKRAAGYPQRVEAVARTRAFFRARFAGRAAHVHWEDVLYTFALIVGAIDAQLATDAVAPWLDILCELPFLDALRDSHVVRNPNPAARMSASDVSSLFGIA